MRHNRGVAGFALAVALAVAAGSALADSGRGNTVHAVLEGYEEVPAVSSPGSGHFRAKIDRSNGSIEYTLSYEGLQGTPFMAHIHVAQRGVNGGISVWLCGNSPDASPPANTPRCPVPGGEVSGVLNATAVVGPAGQLIAPGQMEELLAAIREGVTYVNVHTTAASGGVPSGEIRGQIGRNGRGDSRGHGHHH